MAHYLDSTGLTTLWAKIKALIPTSLKNPNALTMQANGTTVASYDGSSAKTVNITPASIGAAAASHTHSYLPLSGGTVTGSVQVNNGILTKCATIGSDRLSQDYDLYVDGSFGVEGTAKFIDGIDVENNAHIGGKVTIGVDIDDNDNQATLWISDNGNDYAMRVSGLAEFDTAYFGDGFGSDGDILLADKATVNTGNIRVRTNTILNQSCTFSNSEARFGVNGSYTDPYDGQAAGFKFGGSIAATYGYFYNDVKAKNIIVNEGNLSFIVNGTTYKLNMSKAVTLGLVTT